MALSGQLFCIRGFTLKKTADITKLIEDEGGEVAKGPTSKVKYVVIKDKNDKSELSKAAQRKTIIDQDDLKQMVSGKSALSSASSTSKHKKTAQKIPSKPAKKQKTVVVSDNEDEDDDDDEPAPAKKVAGSKTSSTMVTEIKKGKAAADSKFPMGKVQGVFASEVHVVDTGTGPYDAMLNQTNITNGKNNNKFYIIQCLEDDKPGGTCYFWNRWGRVGAVGQSTLLKGSRDTVIQWFKAKFRDKTKNAWENRDNFQPMPGKYHWLPKDYDAEDDDDDDEVAINRFQSAMRPPSAAFPGADSFWCLPRSLDEAKKQNKFLKALMDGDAKAVQDIVLCKEQSVNTRFEGGNTACHILAAQGDEGLLKFILAAGGAPELRNSLKQTALHLAVAQGRVAIVQLFVVQFGSPSLAIRDLNGSNVLHYAIRARRHQVAELLIDHGTMEPGRDEILSALDMQGNTPMQIARGLKDRTAIALLKQAESWHKNMAAGRGFISDLMADMQIQRNSAAGYGPLTDAQVVTERKKNMALGFGTITNKQKSRILLALKKRGSEDAVKQFVHNEGDPNVILDKFSRKTPLHLCSRRGSAAALKVLLDAGANPNQACRWKWWGSRDATSPLHLAVLSGSVPSVKVLLDYEADVNFINKTTGSSALHMAIGKGNIPIVKALLKFGANSFAEDDHGRTAFQLAEKLDDVECMQVLEPWAFEALLWSSETESLHQIIKSNVHLLEDAEAIRHFDSRDYPGILFKLDSLLGKLRDSLPPTVKIVPVENKCGDFVKRALKSYDGLEAAQRDVLANADGPLAMSFHMRASVVTEAVRGLLDSTVTIMTVFLRRTRGEIQLPRYFQVMCNKVTTDISPERPRRLSDADKYSIIQKVKAGVYSVEEAAKIMGTASQIFHERTDTSDDDTDRPFSDNDEFDEYPPQPPTGNVAKQVAQGRGLHVRGPRGMNSRDPYAPVSDDDIEEEDEGELDDENVTPVDSGSEYDDQVFSFRDNLTPMPDYEDSHVSSPRQVLVSAGQGDEGTDSDAPASGQIYAPKSNHRKSTLKAIPSVEEMLQSEFVTKSDLGTPDSGLNSNESGEKDLFGHHGDIIDTAGDPEIESQTEDNTNHDTTNSFADLHNETNLGYNSGANNTSEPFKYPFEPSTKENMDDMVPIDNNNDVDLPDDHDKDGNSLSEVITKTDVTDENSSLMQKESQDDMNILYTNDDGLKNPSTTNKDDLKESSSIDKDDMEILPSTSIDDMNNVSTANKENIDENNMLLDMTTTEHNYDDNEFSTKFDNNNMSSLLVSTDESLGDSNNVVSEPLVNLDELSAVPSTDNDEASNVMNDLPPVNPITNAQGDDVEKPTSLQASEVQELEWDDYSATQSNSWISNNVNNENEEIDPTENPLTDSLLPFEQEGEKDFEDMLSSQTPNLPDALSMEEIATKEFATAEGNSALEESSIVTEESVTEEIASADSLTPTTEAQTIEETPSDIQVSDSITSITEKVEVVDAEAISNEQEIMTACAEPVQDTTPPQTVDTSSPVAAPTDKALEPSELSQTSEQYADLQRSTSPNSTFEDVHDLAALEAFLSTVSPIPPNDGEQDRPESKMSTMSTGSWAEDTLTEVALNEDPYAEIDTEEAKDAPFTPGLMEPGMSIVERTESESPDFIKAQKKREKEAKKARKAKKKKEKQARMAKIEALAAIPVTTSATLPQSGTNSRSSSPFPDAGGIERARANSVSSDTPSLVSSEHQDDTDTLNPNGSAKDKLKQKAKLGKKLFLSKTSKVGLLLKEKAKEATKVAMTKLNNKTVYDKTKLTCRHCNFVRVPNQGLGIVLLKDAAGKQGVRVKEVDKGGVAEAAGVKVDDVLVLINGVDALNLAFQDVVDALRKAPQAFVIDVASAQDVDELVRRTDALKGAPQWWADDQQDPKQEPKPSTTPSPKESPKITTKKNGNKAAPPAVRCVHTVTLDDTFQGLSIKYGVSVAELRKFNKMQTTDHLFSRRELDIPILP
eukprot:m.155933 g.155933  ORF g.155933 m.155933 type:complete len:1988 (-) comp15091_c1_seq1:275-6238(-)